MARPTATIPVMYVTLRNRTASDAPDEFFGGARDRMRGGICMVAFSPIRGLEEIAKAAPFYIPDEKIQLAGIREMPVNELLDEVTTFSQSNVGNIVVYIHGYNIGFEKSCRRAAMFQRALGLHDRLLLLSWPADGKLLKYTWDESDLIWSAPFMAQILKGIAKRIGYGKVDVVAHSLGARGAVQALTRLACRQPDKPLLKELVLIAPDIDRDIFRQELPAVRRLTDRITVYVSENDKALRLSNEIHGCPRLGEAGENLTVFRGVETIDISRMDMRRFSGHLYHLFNPAIIEDLTRLLHTGESAARRPGMESVDREGRQYWRMLPPE